LGTGDILIAPLTDPSWTPLFVPAEAVVVDVGGQMSHAVIVSRELGMPCVVAVTNATQVIRDGSRIRVDGSSGVITILDVPDK
ncbi:MAG: phosphoenolpyruvate-utilizing protein, partial [Acidimicrobiaceae bacterium]|nr:phosphoenolpyruvate-utilizing protein [Acidimicrobiaceae bacterium]